VDLVKASLTHLESLETLTALWNPERYALRRRSRVAAPAVLGSSRSSPQAVWGGEEVFSTVLLLDSTRHPAERRDLRAVADQLESWMDPQPGASLPSDVLFHWGGFRFRGVLAALDQEWVLFAGDGTPTRGWIRLVLRR
jgi:hypothetical protein